MAAEVGILFVHGIGNQVRGETLVSFGDPIFEVLKERIDTTPPSNSDVIEGELTKSERYGAKRTDKVQLFDASLSPVVSSPSAQTEPAYTKFTIASDDPAVGPAEWVMAECHWATAFPPPQSRSVTLWIMQVLPWLCISFFTRRIKNEWGELTSGAVTTWFRPFVRLVVISFLSLALPIISPLVLLLEVFLIFVLVADFLPFKTIQDAITRLNAAISAIIGDSFIFTSSALRQQSVIVKLLRDLTWLQSTFDCKRVTVIAHSQGAAVAYLALKRFRPKEVKLLITFGAGVVKLFQLGDRDQREAIKWTAWFAAFAALFELIAIADGFKVDVLGWGRPGFVALSVIAVIFLIAVALIFGEEDITEIRNQASVFEIDGMRWVDLFAEFDPVPNGPIFLPVSKDNSTISPAKLNMESIEVCNQSSIISDHTSYTTNKDEFVPLIVDAIADLGGSNGQLRRRTPVEREAARGFRRFRVRVELIDQILIFAAVIAFLLDKALVTSAGTLIAEFANLACEKVMESSTGCWKYSVFNTGVASALVGYLVLRLFVEGLSSADKELRSSSMGLSGFLSHALACFTFSYALLGHVGQSSLAESLSHQSPQFSAKQYEGLMIGGVLFIALLFLGLIQTEVFRSKLWRLAGGRPTPKTSTRFERLQK
jgi:hypothetical protein